MKEFNEVAKGSVSEEDFSRAKSVHEQCILHNMIPKCFVTDAWLLSYYVVLN